MTDYCEAAKRGAEFLDEKDPKWAQKVNLTTLDLGSQFFCVLGQLYGDFYDGALTCNLTRHEEIERGFDLGGSAWAKPGAYDELTRCWKDEIRARRKR